MPRTESATIPFRHPAKPGTVPLIGPVTRVLGIEPPTEAQWKEIGEALTIGDDPMESLVDWMYEAGMGSARRLVNQALDEGIDSVVDAPAPLREFFTQVESPPAWVDWDLIAVGQRALKCMGTDGVYIARDAAILGGFVASGINQTLLRTKTGKSGESGGATRFAETMQWALDLFEGVKPGETGYRSTLHVRMIHTFVRRGVDKMPDWQPAEWGLPVNQTDMAATILAALITPVAGVMAMGHVFTPRELKGVAHLTRYSGWLMGVQDRYLPLSFYDALRKLSWYLMALSSPDETSALMAAPMARDPLTWHYRNFGWIRGRIAWAQHLSITSLVLGPTQMRQLGLPAYMPPWYPVVRIPINLAMSSAALAIPGGRERQASAGLRAQKNFMRVLVGQGTKVKVGHSASYAYDAG